MSAFISKWRIVITISVLLCTELLMSLLERNSIPKYLGWLVGGRWNSTVLTELNRYFSVG